MQGTIDDSASMCLTWTLDEPMQRSAHALVDEGRVWLVDPVDWPPALERVAALGEPVAVLQLLDRHGRDGRAVADRLGVPLVEGGATPGAPFAVTPLIQRRGWHEWTLWWERHRLLLVPEAIGTGTYFGLGRPAGVHPLLRLLPPSRLRDPAGGRLEHLLVGHGPPVHAGASAALCGAMDHARGDIPRLLTRLPGMIRAARR